VSGKIAIWLDGTRTSSLPLPNRGLDFGDGVFETFLVYEGNPLFPEYHLDRLRLGLQVLGIPFCLDTVHSQLGTAAREVGKEVRWATLRLNVLRGQGPRGYSPAKTSTPQILIYVSRLDRECAKMDKRAVLCVAKIRLSTQPLLARIKHLNRLEQIMAAAQAQSEGHDESFMLDQAGYLTSVIAGNIFLVCDGQLLTPSLIECGVAGTRRRLIIEKWAPAIGLNVTETRISMSELYRAEEVFYSSSLQTVRSIAKLGDRNWEKHDVCEALFQRFLKELH
jgi:4-amino-4-deoxychorismate lyase